MAASESLGLLLRRAALRVRVHICVTCSVKLISVDPESEDSFVLKGSRLVIR